MADIEAKREARRRKILENSENRLKKITGVETRSTKSELDGICLNTSYENESNSTRLLSNNPVELSASIQDEIHILRNKDSSNSIELETIFQNPRSIANDSVSNCYVDIAEHKSYRHVFILVMPIILSFSLVLFDLFQIDIKSFYLNKIFVPLIIYEIAEYCFGPPITNTPNFLTSMLLLINIANPFLSNFVNHFQSVVNIVQDLLIYFFVFTVSYWLLQVIFV